MGDLITQLKAASGPDRTLDRLIAVHPATPSCGVVKGADIEHVRRAEEDYEEPIVVVPHYTGSLDAALTLVPKGFCCDTQSMLRGSGTFDRPLAWAQVEEINGPIIIDHAAPTLPIAICIAALKATASIEARQQSALSGDRKPARSFGP